MASFKKSGQCNLVRKGQWWRNTQNGRKGYIQGKTKRGKEWYIVIGKYTHHINEGSLLKYFEMV